MINNMLNGLALGLEIGAISNSFNRSCSYNPYNSDDHYQNERLRSEVVDLENQVRQQRIQMIKMQLNTGLKIKANWLNPSQFNDIDATVQKINNSQLTVANIIDTFILSTNNKDGLDWFIENYINDTKDIGTQIGKAFMLMGVTPGYINYDITGINALAKIALIIIDKYLQK